MDEPNVLLLDEPTNDLDIETLTAFEDLLDGWPGALVVVSHDRYFLERVCDRVVALLGDRRLRDLPGGVDEYLERRQAVAAAPPATPGVTRAAAQAAPMPPSARAGGGDVRQARKDLQRVERQLGRLGEREKSLHDSLATHATDYAQVAALDAELREVADERARLEEEWLELAEIADG